jgi:transcriptional regulator with XRE-family HTH domain
VKSLCDKIGISEAQLARDIGQTPQNFNKKLKRDTLDFDEYKAIADVLGVTFEQALTLPNGEKIRISSKDKA